MVPVVAELGQSERQLISSYSGDTAPEYLWQPGHPHEAPGHCPRIKQLGHPHSVPHGSRLEQPGQPHLDDPQSPELKVLLQSEAQAGIGSYKKDS